MTVPRKSLGLSRMLILYFQFDSNCFETDRQTNTHERTTNTTHIYKYLCDDDDDVDDAQTDISVSRALSLMI